MTATSYFRAALHAILFACAGTLLGLTAYHIHFTETVGIDFYVPIIVELLVTSCLAVILCLWFFIAIIGRLGGGHNSYGVEVFILSIVWVMYLVGASIITRRWPNPLWCVGSRQVCHILDAVVAFSWINWAFTTFLIIACLVDMNSSGRSATDPAHGRQTTQTATPAATLA